MNLEFNEEQLELRDMIREFVEREIKPIALQMDKENKMPEDLIGKLGDMGLLDLVVPVEFGGTGLDSVTLAMIYKELGRGCAGTATVVAANALASYPVILRGTNEQKEFWFDFLKNGKLAAFALTEPGAGSDAGSVATRAEKQGDKYILNGTKCFITNGGTADIFLVFANTRKTGGIRGLTCFVVEKGTPGFSIGKKEDKMGIRASCTNELIFDNVEIHESRRVGREGEGFRIAMETLDASRPFVGAVSVGIAEEALYMAVKYSKERRQFGQPISSFQMVQALIADMAMKVEAADLLVMKACALRDAGKDFSKEAAIAKCFASDTAMSVTTDALQVLGGYGYSREYPAEKYMRDAKIMQIYEGTNQIQRAVIANKLLF